MSGHLFAGWALMAAAIGLHIALPDTDAGPFMAGGATVLFLLYLTTEATDAN